MLMRKSLVFLLLTHSLARCLCPHRQQANFMRKAPVFFFPTRCLCPHRQQINFMRKAPIFFFLLFLSVACVLTGNKLNAQSRELTSLKASLAHSSDSLHYVDALNRMAMLLYEKNVDSTFYYTRQARDIAGRLDYDKGKADALNNLGVFFDIKGNLQLALRYYDEGYAAYRQLKDSANCVQALMNIAMVYKEIGK